MTAELRVEWIEDPARLASLDASWRDLVRQSPYATPFQSPDWLMPWWSTFAPGPILTPALWRSERLVGLAPLFLERRDGRDRLIPFGIGISDYLDVLVAQEPESAALAEALASVDAPSIELEDLRPEAAALGMANAHGLASEVQPQIACPTLSLGATLGETIPPGKMRQVRHDLARAARRGQVDVAPNANASSFLSGLFDLHRLRWTGRGTEGVLADCRVQAFHRAALPRLIAAGTARCFELRIGGELAGSYFGLHAGREAFYYIGGFDPRFSPESPGAILIGHAIERAIAEGAHTFHFLRGQEPYKYRWGAVDRWSSKRVLRRRSAR